MSFPLAPAVRPRGCLPLPPPSLRLFLSLSAALLCSAAVAAVSLPGVPPLLSVNLIVLNTSIATDAQLPDAEATETSGCVSAFQGDSLVQLLTSASPPLHDGNSTVVLGIISIALQVWSPGGGVASKRYEVQGACPAIAWLLRLCFVTFCSRSAAAANANGRSRHPPPPLPSICICNRDTPCSACSVPRPRAVGVRSAAVRRYYRPSLHPLYGRLCRLRQRLCPLQHHHAHTSRACAPCCHVSLTRCRSAPLPCSRLLFQLCQHRVAARVHVRPALHVSQASAHSLCSHHPL